MGQPTVVETSSTEDRIFKEEIFGPVVTAFVYPDSQTEAMLGHVVKDMPYALTGAIFSQDQAFADAATEKLKGSAGNFYVNDKSGGPHYMLKWASPQSVKQTFVPLRDVEYPYM